jgi:hypothetical protein
LPPNLNLNCDCWKKSATGGKMNAMQLKEGELEKAKSWAQTVAEALFK